MQYNLDCFSDTGICYPLIWSEGSEADNLFNKYQQFQQQSLDHRGRETFIKPHLLANWAYQIATCAEILDPVTTIFGENILLWSSDFFVKQAGSKRFVTWHQDTPFWHLEPLNKTVSVWLSITPSTVRSGCMRVVPGSHLDGELTSHWRGKDQGASPDDLLSAQQMLKSEVWQSQVVNVVLQPGQFSIHHGLAIHGGSSNQADHDRIGFILRYITTDTRQTKAQDSAILVQGKDAYQHYLPEQPPDSDFSPAALRQHQAVLQRPSGFNDMVVK